MIRRLYNSTRGLTVVVTMDLNLLLRAGGGIFTVSLVKKFICAPQKLTNLHAKRKCFSNVKQERLSEFINYKAFNDACGI